MAEITRVPLQPIRKGSLTKLWLGVVVLLALAGALAWYTVPRGVTLTEHTAGAGGHPTKDDVVIINYVGKLADGTVFDQGQGVPLPVAGSIPGFTEGLLKMQKGGKYTLVIPANKAYGEKQQTDPRTGKVVIPANSELTFDVDLLEFMSVEDFQRQMQLQQQLMQMQQQQGAHGGQGMPEGMPQGAPGEAMPQGMPPQ